MVFPVLDEMQQKLGLQIFAYWFDQNFQQIILYLLYHQELMMMKSMGSYGSLSMLFVLQVMV
jgi:hypothetical protein